MPGKKSPKYRLILSTCPDSRTAKRIATILVQERLAACVNIVPVLQSVYRWKGKVETAKEMLLVIKSRGANYGKIEKRICSLHPYELPEIISVGIESGYRPYLNWIENPE